MVNNVHFIGSQIENSNRIHSTDLFRLNSDLNVLEDQIFNIENTVHETPAK